MTPEQRRHLIRIGLVVAALLAGAAAAWRYTPLAEWLTLERVLAWIEHFSGYWWAPLAVALLYTPASLVLFPRPTLTIAAALAFGPWKGFATAMAGIALNALLGYLAGRRVDAKKLDRWGGPKMAAVRKALKKEGLAAVAMLGLLPVAPFIVEVVAFGAMRIPLWHVLGGTALANAPGTLGSTLLGDQVRAVLSHDRTFNVWIVVAVIVAMAAIAFFTRRFWKRMQAAAAAA